MQKYAPPRVTNTLGTPLGSNLQDENGEVDAWNISECGAWRCWSLHNTLRDRMGLQCISVVMQRSRLRWFGHEERMGDGNWVKRIRSMNIGGVSARGRPQ